MTGSRSLGLLGALALLSGCVVAPGPPAASQGPPSASAGEAVPVQPGPASSPAPGPVYVWVPEHWTWRDATYVWSSGAWLLPPRPGYMWTPGHWVASGAGQVWVDGYWYIR